MSKLVLEFSSGQQPELLGVLLEHPLSGPARYSVRGKTTGAHAAQGTFQWTSAVQALAMLLLRTAAAARACSNSQAASGTIVLQGGAASPAAALDYALSKQPAWLLEMFGADKRRRPLARRFIRRSNPERKRRGPVVLSVNTQVLPAADISVFSGTVPLTHPDLIEHLADTVAAAWSKRYGPRRAQILLPRLGITVQRQAGAEPGQEASSSADLLIAPALLERILKREIEPMLRETPPGRAMWLTEAVHTAGRRLEVREILEQKDAWTDTAEFLDRSCRLYAGSEEMRLVLGRGEPIRCAVPWINAAALGLFYYLKHFQRLNLVLDYEYFYSIELRKKVTEGAVLPDLFVVGIGPAVTLLNQGGCKYSAYMFLPNNSHRIVVSRAAGESPAIGYGDYALLCDEPSTSLFYFEELVRRSAVSRAEVAVGHMAPEDVPGRLREGDPDLRAVMFFPHYTLNEMFNDCLSIKTPQRSIDTQETVLFVHESLAAEKKRLFWLDMALRKAWRDLRDNELLREQVIRAMAGDAGIARFLSEFTGLRNMIAAQPRP